MASSNNGNTIRNVITNLQYPHPLDAFNAELATLKASWVQLNVQEPLEELTRTPNPEDHIDLVLRECEKAGIKLESTWHSCSGGDARQKSFLLECIFSMEGNTPESCSFRDFYDPQEPTLYAQHRVRIRKQLFGTSKKQKRFVPGVADKLAMRIWYFKRVFAEYLDEDRRIGEKWQHSHVFRWSYRSFGFSENFFQWLMFGHPYKAMIPYGDRRWSPVHRELWEEEEVNTNEHNYNPGFYAKERDLINIGWLGLPRHDPYKPPLGSGEKYKKAVHLYQRFSLEALQNDTPEYLYELQKHIRYPCLHGFDGNGYLKLEYWKDVLARFWRSNPDHATGYWQLNALGDLTKPTAYQVPDDVVQLIHRNGHSAWNTTEPDVLIKKLSRTDWIVVIERPHFKDFYDVDHPFLAWEDTKIILDFLSATMNKDTRWYRRRDEWRQKIATQCQHDEKMRRTNHVLDWPEELKRNLAYTLVGDDIWRWLLCIDPEPPSWPSGNERYDPDRYMNSRIYIAEEIKLKMEQLECQLWKMFENQKRQ